MQLFDASKTSYLCRKRLQLVVTAVEACHVTQAPLEFSFNETRLSEIHYFLESLKGDLQSQVEET